MLRKLLLTRHSFLALLIALFGQRCLSEDMAEEVQVDYLVVGAGAMGLAFVDTMISDSKATMALVDRYARPGGHWTMAYPHVRLHQPSKGYGVNSRRLGEDSIDTHGWNKGLLELATGDQVCAYYSTVMHQTLLPSGRVKYYPKHEYTGEGGFKSLLTDKAYQVGPDTKIVDATYMKVEVPSMRPPPYQVTEGVDVITPNALAKLDRPYAAYTVVGTGKTGLDACLWLLGNGVDPKQMTLVVSRDGWFLDRHNFQPGLHFQEASGAHFASTAEAVMTATSPDDLFRRLESCGELLRLDESIQPSYYRCATVTKLELEYIKKIGNIVRQGRVKRITPSEVTLERGTYQPANNTLYIDCSANSVPKRKPVPVFSDNTITLQPMRFCQQVFSAAFIAHVEASYTADAELQNSLTTPVPHPDTATDWIRLQLQTYRNALAWTQQPHTMAWLAQARLDWFKEAMPKPPEDEEGLKVFMEEMGNMIVGMLKKLEALLVMLPEDDGAREDVQLARL